MEDYKRTVIDLRNKKSVAYYSVRHEPVSECFSFGSGDSPWLIKEEAFGTLFNNMVFLDWLYMRDCYLEALVVERADLSSIIDALCPTRKKGIDDPRYDLFSMHEASGKWWGNVWVDSMPEFCALNQNWEQGNGLRIVGTPEDYEEVSYELIGEDDVRRFVESFNNIIAVSQFINKKLDKYKGKAELFRVICETKAGVSFSSGEKAEREKRAVAYLYSAIKLLCSKMSPIEKNEYYILDKKADVIYDFSLSSTRERILSINRSMPKEKMEYLLYLFMKFWGGPCIGFQNIETAEIATLCDCLEEYTQMNSDKSVALRVKNLIFEARKRLSKESDDWKTSSSQHELDREDSENVAQFIDESLQESTYLVYSVSELLCVLAYECLNKGVTIRRCAACSNLFIERGGKNSACSRPAWDAEKKRFSNVTCRKSPRKNTREQRTLKKKQWGQNLRRKASLYAQNAIVGEEKKNENPEKIIKARQRLLVLAVLITNIKFDGREYWENKIIPTDVIEKWLKSIFTPNFKTSIDSLFSKTTNTSFPRVEYKRIIPNVLNNYEIKSELIKESPCITFDFKGEIFTVRGIKDFDRLDEQLKGASDRDIEQVVHSFSDAIFTDWRS